MHWDYHVVLLLKNNGWKVCPAETYLSESFVATEAPVFSVVDADQYIRRFVSDRRHMIDQNGMYLKAPPAWDMIGTGFNLWGFVDGEYGRGYNLHEMYTAFA